MNTRLIRPARNRTAGGREEDRPVATWGPDPIVAMSKLVDAYICILKDASVDEELLSRRDEATTSRLATRTRYPRRYRLAPRVPQPPLTPPHLGYLIALSVVFVLVTSQSQRTFIRDFKFRSAPSKESRWSSLALFANSVITNSGTHAPKSVMPLGFERLNERSQRPNAHINFIRTLPGRTAPTAEAILNRVAAVCYPFMKKHMILVQALEEFPYNNEFVGRNFNAGEVIQLVLRNRQGQWLPEKWVMMVMVHELAHCKQMNHSKAFWKVRNEYAADLQELWRKGYTGEGLWGKGRSLDTGQVHTGSVEVGDVPEHLCGGTYGRKRKRKRGRKAKETISYAERKQRRILKKFGVGGQALGSDDDTKLKLEGGIAKKGKPRVASSARGRDLRAAAALARFETVKKEDVDIKREESDTESEDEYEDIGDEEATIDVDGKKLVDGKGRALVKICEDEDDRDGDAKREKEEIQHLDLTNDGKTGHEHSRPAPRSNIPIAENTTRSKPATPDSRDEKSTPSGRVIHLDEIFKRRPDSDPPRRLIEQSAPTTTGKIECEVCSLVNETGCLTCAACSNVLNPRLAPDHWRCSRPTCNSQYINPGDAGVCGLCGSPKVKQ